MYLDHFGLTEPPFRITPHTDFFFDGANRGATLDALIYAITHDEGIVKVSGEVGSGKTMLCRVLMERLPANVTIVYLANPSLSRDDILFALADELGLNISENARASMVLRALQEHLIKAYGEQRQVVVLIDEAHAMPIETLEEIRLLSNLESNHSKLLQLVLFGQPELNLILSRPDMRQLKERITHNFTLEPLIREDISNYLEFRMRAAGYRGPNVFAPQSVLAISRASLGLTRRINIIADKALLAAFALGVHQIDAKITATAIRDGEFAKVDPKNPVSLLRRSLAATGLLAIVGAAIGFHRWQDKAPPALPPTSAAELPVQASPLPADKPATPTPPASTESAAPAPMPAPQNSIFAAPHSLGEKTRAALENGKSWLASAKDEHWFIQLLSTDLEYHVEMERLLSSAIASKQIRANELRAYQANIDGVPRLAVIYGDYSTRADALAAIKTLPDNLREAKPYPRRVARLRS